MEQFEQFWHNKFAHLDSQLQLDYDTFINIFSEEIRNQTSIELTELQKKIIKSEVDPENQNQVYKSGYLLFVKNFWGIPSQRTKFFNMKTNLSRLKSQLDPAPMAGWIKIKVTYEKINKEEQAAKSLKQVDEYLIKNDKITFSSSTTKSNPINKQKELSSVGFIRIGSSEANDIVIPSSSVNEYHLKLIYFTNIEQQGKSTASFKAKSIPVNRVYLRDLSSSNRTGFLINNELNYFAIKTGMIVTGVGLMEGIFEVVIDSAPPVQTPEVTTLLQSLNADRKSFLIGQPDKPLKIITNFDIQPIKQSTIADMYDRNLFYPEAKTKPAKISNQEKTRPPLKFRIINKRTLEQKNLQSKNLKYLTVGRDPEKCNVVIDHISIRPIEFVFECINQLWFIRRPNIKLTERWKNVSVLLSKDKTRCSNRLPLNPEYPSTLVIKNNVQIQIEIMDREKKKEDDDDYY